MYIDFLINFSVIIFLRDCINLIVFCIFRDDTNTNTYPSKYNSHHFKKEKEKCHLGSEHIRIYYL